MGEQIRTNHQNKATKVITQNPYHPKFRVATRGNYPKFEVTTGTNHLYTKKGEQPIHQGEPYSKRRLTLGNLRETCENKPTPRRAVLEKMKNTGKFERNLIPTGMSSDRQYWTRMCD
uniref:Uncharacterized protein n=1 Tax=Cacopsylla melanoneura TaxID=428564 RepID=A0A8D9AW89_9HEMI